jgi:hypothetical protein
MDFSLGICHWRFKYVGWGTAIQRNKTERNTLNEL